MMVMGLAREHSNITMCKDFPRFEHIIQYCWEIDIAEHKMYNILQKLKKVKHGLKLLNKAGFLEVHAEVVKTTVVMDDIQQKLH